MTYIRPNTLNQSLSLDGQPLDNAVLTTDRRNLVDEFNTTVGKPGTVAQAMQHDFIAGKMPFDEMVSYVRFCEYMIDSAKKHSASAIDQAGKTEKIRR